MNRYGKPDDFQKRVECLKNQLQNTAVKNYGNAIHVLVKSQSFPALKEKGNSAQTDSAQSKPLTL